jgi:hypothetical protein
MKEDVVPGFRVPELPELLPEEVVPEILLLAFDLSDDMTKYMEVGPGFAGLVGDVGPDGYVLTSNGLTADWEPIAVSASAQKREIVATAGQTVFQTDHPYMPGYIAVYVNGARLSETEFTATDGVNVVLVSPAQANDIVLLDGFLGSGVAVPGPAGPAGPAGPSGAQVMFVGDNPPPAPVVGQTWWESDTGNTFVYYDDGNTQQWVPAHVGAVSIDAPSDGKIYGRKNGAWVEII